MGSTRRRDGPGSAPDARLLVLHEHDDVGVCLRDARAGSTLVALVHRPRVVLREDIPAGHKVAIHDIPAGSTVHKYGEPIGRATIAIRRGAHVHVHNLESLRARVTAR
jgi:hypothetical protein